MFMYQLIFLPGWWCLNRRRTFSNWWIIFRRDSWCSSFVDSWIVYLRITDHSHEKWTLLSQCLFSLAIQNFRYFVGLLLFQQFGCKICYYLPSDIWNIWIEGRKKRVNKSFQFAEIVCRNQFNLPISSSVQLWATTQNRMTYLSLTEAGTMWSLPDPLIILNSFSFNLSEPTKRKHTNPS